MLCSIFYVLNPINTKSNQLMDFHENIREQNCESNMFSTI